MKSSNYVNFLETFLKYFETDYENHNQELAISEILEFSFKRFKEEHIIFISLFVGVLGISSIFPLILLEFEKAFLIIFLGYILLSLGFFRIPRFNRFNRKNLMRLRMRLDYLKARYMNDLNYSKEETLRLIKAASPEICEKEIVAEKIYYKLTQSNIDKKEGKDERLTNPVRLYLLYILLNYSFKISTRLSDKDFNYIIAALTGIKHPSLQSTELTNLKLLYKFLDPGNKDLSDKKKKELLEILESVNRYMLNTKDVQELINQVKLDLSLDEDEVVPK